ncbi:MULTISPECIES: hypothetical protein [Streptosporangium]|uniref:Uncharacterized protein n=1 Tax=Streptosporangium brasiliense TaxID=47480 RepID=A0ABT9R9W6_9ACTN|nr:hypothetical protein [Streptosporangium brasiliense]MDP9866043.1 hypothetical protein [Streptosporangium brasiliense]
MRITICGTADEIDALPFRRLRTVDGADLAEVIVIVDLDSARLRRDPYGDAYRLCADVLDPGRKEAM